MSIIKVQDIAFVRFRAPDLGEMQAFLEDFGLTCFLHAGKLYSRGCGADPYVHVTELGAPEFAGVGFRAASREDLAALGARDGCPVEPLDAPGAGYSVVLRDPDGFAVEVVADQAESSAAPIQPNPQVNAPEARRRLRAPVRFVPGPSSIFRLGHAVLNVTDFQASEAWYKERFGLTTSDQIEVEPGVPIGAFMRCDRGVAPTDHHTLFLLQARSGPGYNHAAFEVGGLDDLMKGHTFLKDRNRAHVWGIGRHILGSQIFDYWKDPWGHELEHWTDGDLFNAADPPGTAGLEELLGTLWGPRHPAISRR